VWREEVASHKSGYKYTQFSSLYAKWRVENGLKRCLRYTRKVVSIEPGDEPVLKKWSLSRDRRKWEVAIALLNSLAGISTLKTVEKIGRTPRTIDKWLLSYKEVE
jgi:hypothetical protein